MLTRVLTYSETFVYFLTSRANGTLHLDAETKTSLLNKAKEVDKAVRAITNDPAALTHDSGILMGFVAILFAATLGGVVANSLGMSQTAGYIFAGMILGPSVLHIVDNLSSVVTFAQFGSIFLLFDHGAAYPIKQLKQHRKSALLSTMTTCALLSIMYGATNIVYFGMMRETSFIEDNPNFIMSKAADGAITGVAVSFSSFSVALLQHARDGITTLHRGHAISIDSMTEDHVVLGSFQENKSAANHNSAPTHAQIAMSALAMQELLMGIVLTFMQRQQMLSFLGIFTVMMRIGTFGLIVLAFDCVLIPALLHAVNLETYNGAFSNVVCSKTARSVFGVFKSKTKRDTQFLGIDSIPVWSKDRKELFILGIVSISLLVAVSSHLCGLSLEAGALISGLLFSKCNHGEKVSGLMDSLTQVFGALVSVMIFWRKDVHGTTTYTSLSQWQFFASMGLVVSPFFILQHFSIIMLLIIQLLIYKVLVNTIVIKLFSRVPLSTAGRAAMMLAGISELSLVLVHRAESVGLVTREVYLQILSSAVIAMVSSQC